MKEILHYASLVKISHTIFAMPFAAAGYFLAIQQTQKSISWQIFLCVVLCMFFARNAAMSFNRYADRKYDALNKRTNSREIPQGIIAPRHALLFCIINSILFVISASAINSLCFALAPLGLLIILGYSYTKRFTLLCHFVLGLGLAIAPIGAYIAVAGEWSMTPLLLSLLVLLWVAGFDIIYALPDEDFDKKYLLHSIPAAMGVRRALMVSTILHIVCAILTIIIGIYINAGLSYFMGGGGFILCIVYQHNVVSPRNISRINLAFATFNGIASIVYCAFFIVECL